MSADDRHHFADRFRVDKATLALLDRYAEMLRDWQPRMNLVAPSTLDAVWVRHFWDSAQLLDHIPPGARTLVDLGSGAGFPGMVLAILLRGRPDHSVTLLDATQKKCRFLEAVAAATGVQAQVIWGRAERMGGPKADVITARAVAPLDELLGLARAFAKRDSVCLFLKGRSWEDELTAASRGWNLGAGGNLRVDALVSETDPSSRILRATGLAH